ncbi:MAG: pyridoxine 5'-phosphate synthase [Pyrinomonadaceae bacterium]
MRARLNINIDHIATIRQARRAPEPSVVAAAMICELAGADGITIHLRGDRRHIQDKDLYDLRSVITTYLNVEMAATDEMVAIALKARPDAVTFVAENPNEITTEGGLDVRANFKTVAAHVKELKATGIMTSLFIDPETEQILAASECHATQIELCTAKYAEATLPQEELRQGARPSRQPLTRASTQAQIKMEFQRLSKAAKLAASRKLRVAAGHGMTYRNVGAIAAITDVEEFNIGHNIVARAALVGLDRAVREMIAAIDL